MAKISINIKEGKVDKISDIIVGIDLGTTNSLVAYIKDKKAEAVKDKNGKSTLVPSIVHFAKDGGIIVGDEAREKLISDPGNTIYSVKRLMGKSYDDVENFEQYFGYKIIDEDTESLVKVRVNDKFYTPIELSAEILKSLKHRIEKDLGEKINKAVITVPAYFNDSQRQATRDAGKLAGLDVLRIVNEPTAASLAYGIGLNPEETRTIAVYDLGGGTFDISILQIQNGIFEVLSTNGDTFLGGDDFDRAIIDFWVKENNLDPTLLNQNKELSQAIRLEAEHAKKSLSGSDEFSSSIENLHLKITKTQFEKLTQPLIQRTLDCCKNALVDAKISVEKIDHIVMVGGSTRIPLVQNTVSDFFGKTLFNELNPDEVVALGAAIQADVLAGNQKDILLLDVTPLSLGIETVGGLMDTIIPRNSKVPNKAGRQYTTSVDGQKNLKVAVYQGERDLVNDNRKLGEFILKGIPPMPAGLPKIEIQFILNADGILKVKAKELRSNVETEIEIKSQYGLSEEEMAKMLIDSIQNAEADMKIRGLLEARNEANNILLSSDKFLQQNEAILSEEEKATTKSLIENLRKSVNEEDKDAINKAMDDLNTFTSPLAHRAMDVNIQKAMKGKKV
ncbi:MAG: Fe-S protein assembly chaperone HscA [Saprospiraceae bacterium]